MAKPNKRKGPDQLGDPHVLLGIAERRQRKLTAPERVEVLTMLIAVGKTFTQREMAKFFQVSQPVIFEDMKAVRRALADRHREAAKLAEERVISWTYQIDRVLRELWTQYEAEKAPYQKALILMHISRVIHRQTAQMQDRGLIPRAPQKVEPNAVLVALPELSVVAQGVMEAAQRTGLTRPQLEAFKQDLLRTFRAEAHEKAVFDGSSNGGAKPQDAG